MAKNYKEFNRISIGASDICTLIAVAPNVPLDMSEIHFDADGTYTAYECFGDVEIPDSYKVIFSGKHWLKIYDDESLAYFKIGDEFTIYRRGGFGCIIHWSGTPTDTKSDSHAGTSWADIIRAHYDEIVEAMMELDAENPQYQTDLYLYPDGTTGTVANPGGQAHTSGEHLIVFSVDFSGSPCDWDYDERKVWNNENREMFEQKLDDVVSRVDM